jgi:hypothetical protein
VKPVVAYGSEMWPMTEMDMKRLNTWDRKILRRIYGSVVEQETWRIRNNQTLGEPYEDSDTVTDVKKQRLEWIGHLVRMDRKG